MSGRVKGAVAKQSIQVNSVLVENQEVWFAEEIEIPILEDVAWDGILGLAFQNKKLKDWGTKTFIDNIIGKNFKKIRTY